MSNGNLRALNAQNALRRLEIKNGGRWCEVTLKSTGERVTVIRTGFGPMERPEHDSHKVKIGGLVVAEFSDLLQVAIWLCQRK